MEQYEALERALALIERPGGWTQKAFCRQRLGAQSVFTADEPGFWDTAANAYCALGAIGVACGGNEDLQEACTATLDALALDDFGGDVEEVNDGAGAVAEGAAFDHVRVIFRQAIRETKAAAAAGTAVALPAIGPVAERHAQAALARIAGG